MSVHHTSGNYRDADYLVGMAAAVAVLLVLLFHSHPFALWAMPVDVVLGFVAGAALELAYSAAAPCAAPSIAAARRGGAILARAAFVSLGVWRTRGRTGIFIYASLFERVAVVVPDVGVDPKSVGHGWTVFADAASESVRRRDFDEFERAVRSLGPALSQALPRADDDENEIPNAMDVT